MPENDQLSERERELLQLVATGASNKEIAQKLSISTNTVKVHLRNIFAKTGVVSRTEATLYAIQHGIVALDNSLVNNQPVTITTESSPSESVVPLPLENRIEIVQPLNHTNAVAAPFIRRFNTLWLVTLFLILAIVIAGFGLLMRQSTLTVSASPVPPVASVRWQQKSSMPTARSGLAAVNYERVIYTIGGERETTVVSTTESYDTAKDTWTTKQSKPTAVTDVSAAIVGGKIYVPGGRLADGSMTSVCEVYDPREDKWSRVTSLPVSLSGYALVSFEGKLYLFGGTDGQHYLSTVYSYDPSQDNWIERTPIPNAQAFAGATIVGGKIYILGGYDGKQALKTTEEYLPENDDGKAKPWTQRAAMPTGRYGMGVASIADIIHIVGGIDESGKSPAPIEYLSQSDKWQEFDSPPTHGTWSNLVNIPIETYIYTFGGKMDGKPTGANLAYRAIYTIIVPTLR